MRVLLGKHPIAAADVSALPAMMALCRALGTPAEWDPIGEDLYINPPLTGRRIRVETGHNEALGRALRERLRPLGAEVVGSGETDAALRIVVVRKRSAQVSAVYGWPGSEAARRFAHLLAQRVAEECGLTLGPVRQSLTARLGSGNAAGLIVAHVESGDLHLTRWIADGICRALLAYWPSDGPVEERHTMPLPEPHTEVVTEPMSPAPPDPRLAYDGQEEPRLVLDPDPSLITAAEEPILAMVASVPRQTAEPTGTAEMEDPEAPSQEEEPAIDHATESEDNWVMADHASEPSPETAPPVPEPSAGPSVPELPATPSAPAPTAPVQAGFGGPKRLPGLPGSMKPVGRSPQLGRSTRSRFGKQGDPRIIPGIVEQAAFRWGESTPEQTPPHEPPPPAPPSPPAAPKPVPQPRTGRVQRQPSPARVIHHTGTVISYVFRTTR